ncbi:MAG: hsp70 family protein [Candidatus Xenolissoclinum pacificiensis L6]|uniref:Hsp70 family protein n=1 Tax=Candidatus Xenolissoclinum pacificiensis L6 TaxID=1401685 RepID=W2V0U8_9RICK|nr:MAG: hsp70 family protein [Candidatus Xenolissoclinum pacificiensis L6]
MTLIQITEPENEKSYNGFVLGIDFGTTNSLVAFYDGIRAHVISDQNGNLSLPSCVFIDDEGIIQVGYSQKNYIRSVKRFITSQTPELLSHFTDMRFKIVDGCPVFYDSESREYMYVNIVAKILSYLVTQAKVYLNQEVQKAVITVPAYFDHYARKTIQDASKVAHIDLIRLLNEPTASLVAYGIDKSLGNGKICAVYDFGGGTFDVSVIKISDGILDVIGTGGDNFLGGDDIDKEIADYIKDNFKNTNSDLYDLARKVKENFDQSSEEGLLPNNVLKGIFDSYIEKTFTIMDNTLKDVGCFSKIDAVLLVGGSTKSKYLQHKVSQRYNKVIFLSEPDMIVVRGAAIHAHNIVYATGNILAEVIPLSLGIETINSIMSIMIARNTPIPCECSEIFTNYADNQRYIVLNIWQGEQQYVTLPHMKFLGTLKIKISNTGENYPKYKSKIKVIFKVDENAILQISAYNEDTHETIEDIIKTSSLSEDELSDMVSVDSGINNKKVLFSHKSDLKLFVDNIKNLLCDERDYIDNNLYDEICESLILAEQVIRDSTLMSEVSFIREKIEALTSNIIKERIIRYMNNDCDP